MVAEFRRRRDAFVAGLNTIPGFRCACPEARSTRSPISKGPACHRKELADRLLNEAGVACLSGTSFGEYGEGYMRFSYANSLENLTEAVERIRKWLTALRL